MKLTIIYSLTLTLLLSATLGFANNSKRYGTTLCKKSDYFCIKVRAGESWRTLFPHPEARDIVRRINRMNIALKSGMTIAVPKYLDRLTIYDVSPFPR